MLIQKLFLLTTFRGCSKFEPFLNHKGPSLWWNFFNVFKKLFFIAQMKRTEAHWMQWKNPALYKVRFLTNLKKKLNQFPFLMLLVKNGYFGGDSWFFQLLYFVNRWGFLRCTQRIKMVLWSYPKRFLKKFKIFTIRGDAYDSGGGGGGGLRQPLKGVEN